MDAEYEKAREGIAALEVFLTDGVGAHIHHQVEAIVVRKGALYVTEGSVTERLTEGQAAIADSYTVHAYLREPESEGIVMIVPKEYLGDYRLFMRGKTFGSAFVTDRARGGRILEMMELLKEERGDSLAARGLVNAVLGQYIDSLPLKQRDSDPALFMRDALIYLSDNFTEAITLKSLAKRFGYTPTHFSRVFNAYTGGGINEFLGSLRAEYAAGLLRGGASVTDAAMDAGFASMRTFYRAFKNKYGVTPRAFARR